MNKLQNVPQDIFIGKKGQAILFDDMASLLAEPHPHKLCQIKVQIRKQSIYGMRFTYETGLKKKKVVGHNSTTHFTFLTYIKSYRFDIDQDDFLYQIEGSEAGYLTSIGFSTYKGKKALFGVMLGKKFAHSFVGHTFTHARGSLLREAPQHLAFEVVRIQDQFLCLQPKKQDETSLNHNQQQIPPVIHQSRTCQSPQSLDKYQIDSAKLKLIKQQNKQREKQQLQKQWQLQLLQQRIQQQQHFSQYQQQQEKYEQYQFEQQQMWQLYQQQQQQKQFQQEQHQLTDQQGEHNSLHNEIGTNANLGSSSIISCPYDRHHYPNKSMVALADKQQFLLNITDEN